MSRHSRFPPAARKKVSIDVNPGVNLCGDDERMLVTSGNGGVGKELWREVIETTGDQGKEKTESNDNPSSAESDCGGGTGSGNHEVDKPGVGGIAVF